MKKYLLLAVVFILLNLVHISYAIPRGNLVWVFNLAAILYTSFVILRYRAWKR